MKHALITGGAGFIGSHLAECLLAADYRVTVIDDESTGSVENLAAIRDHFHFSFVSGTAADKGLMRRLLGDVDEVYHLAAAVGVQLINSAPIHTIETNVYLTELLLSELLRRTREGGQVKLFLASSSEVYGKNPKPRWTEDDDLVFGPTTRPRWSYGASKAIDEFLALAYWREHGLPVVIGRFFNVVGPRQTGRYGMVLPRFVDAALNSAPLLVHGDGMQTRCFAHVLDVVRSVIELMRTEAAVAGVFNIGSDEPITILQLAEKVLSIVRPSGMASVVFQKYEDAFDKDFEDVRCRVPDLSRLQNTIDYRASHTLEMIIAEVVEHTRLQLRSKPWAELLDKILQRSGGPPVSQPKMPQPHIIRLRGPWELQPLARWQSRNRAAENAAPAAPPDLIAERLPAGGRIEMPADWSGLLGTDFYGRVRHRRRFNRPTGLDSGERVWIVCEGATDAATIALNGTPLGDILGPTLPARFEITGRLLPRNELVIDVEFPAANTPIDLARHGLAAGSGCGGLTGEVRLEIDSLG